MPFYLFWSFDWRVPSILLLLNEYIDTFIFIHKNLQIKKLMNIPINAESIYNPQSAHKGKSWS